MRWLSGLHAIPLSLAFVDVRRRGGAPPSDGTSHKSDVCSLSSYAGSMTENTTSFPSGETKGAPTLGISHNASCVTGSFVWAWPAMAPQITLRVTTTMRLIRKLFVTGCFPPTSGDLSAKHRKVSFLCDVCFLWFLSGLSRRGDHAFLVSFRFAIAVHADLGCQRSVR